MERATLVISVAYAIGFSAIVAIGTIVALSAREQQPIMAIFPPGTPLVETLSAVEDAGVRITGFGPVGWVVAVTPLDQAAQFALRREGAWLLLDAQLLAVLCGPIIASTEDRHA